MICAMKLEEWPINVIRIQRVKIQRDPNVSIVRLKWKWLQKVYVNVVKNNLISTHMKAIKFTKNIQINVKIVLIVKTQQSSVYIVKESANYQYNRIRVNIYVKNLKNIWHY